MQDFNGKVAVITGAGRGIGRGIALQCASEGMKVVLAGYGLESISKTAADLQELGAETLVVQTDVSVLSDVQHLAEKSYEAFGAVDLLVNNAGVASPGSVLESSIDDWKWVMDVNFYGVLYGVKTFLPRMMQQDSPSHLVNVSSLSGILPGGRSYGVSKHAVVVLSESLYKELMEAAPQVKVTVYCPGWVATEFSEGARSRPDRYQENATQLSEEAQAGWRKAISQGFSLEDAANILFAGLREEKLYIGPQAFQKQVPEIFPGLRARTENILNEHNPKPEHLR